MHTTAIINIYLDIFCVVISLLVTFFVVIAENGKTRVNRLFLGIMVCGMIRFMNDAVSWGLDGTAHHGGVYRVSCFLLFFFQYALVAFFTEYHVSYIDTKTKAPRTAANAVYIVCGAAVVMLIVSQFNNMYYFIDENNVYHRQGLFWVSQACQYIGMLINFGIAVRHRKVFTKRELGTMLAYIVLPIFAVIFQTLFYGLPLGNITAMLSALIVYMGIQTEQARMLKQSELELTEARIDIMLSQIQPHFLYNSLTAIGKLCDIDAKKAKVAVTDFADYLRGNLDSIGERKLIYFENELEHVEAYLALEQLRYKERLRVVYEINAGGFIIPPLTVQPLVENAVQHGLMEKDEGGLVCIRTEITERDVRVTVTDDGVGFDPSVKKDDGHTHVGIENVRGRIFAMCGGSLEIASAPGTGTTAVIIIPRNTEEQIL